MTKKIKFFGNNSNTVLPSPSSKNLPTWFKNGKRIISDENGNDIITWKACPALYDIMATGYVLKTPCDIEVTKHNNKTMIVPKDSGHFGFVIYRGTLSGYSTPKSAIDDSYAWQPDWRIVLPTGYSALFLHPVNRSDLPFTTISGTIDSDVFSEYGSFPFFIDKDFSGIIPKGTPYVQVIPFKRDSWESEIKHVDNQIESKKKDNIIKKLRIPGGGVYFREFWNRKSYR